MASLRDTIAGSVADWLKLKPKRYALFSYQQYYPSGGWNDLVDTFDTQAMAEAYLAEPLVVERFSFCDYQIVDLRTGTIVSGDGSR